MLGACTTHGSVVVFFLLLWLSVLSGFLEVFEKPNRSSFTCAFTVRRPRLQRAAPPPPAPSAAP
jgi:hypothetical protein